jgi:hypothetical protein
MGSLRPLARAAFSASAVAVGGKRTEVAMPLLAFAFGLVGTAVILRWCLREVRRVNSELDTVRARAEPIDRKTMPTLKADPRTGEYRPG